MAYSLRRFSKPYIQYKTNLFQRVQNISTILCVPMNAINPFFSKTFKRFTELLYGIVEMMANVTVSKSCGALLRNNFSSPPLLPLK